MSSSVLVVGESLIDVVRRDGSEVRAVGGSPANVAMGLGRLGIPVRFHTGIARDADGEAIAKHLEASGVVVDERSWCLSSTSVAAVEVGADGVPEYVFQVDATIEPPQLDGESIVHVGSLGAFMEPGSEAVRAFVDELPSGVLLTVDPNIRPSLMPDRGSVRRRFEALCMRASLVKMSDEDAAWLYPDWDEADVVARVRQHGVALVVVTHGGEGALLETNDASEFVHAPKIVVADTIGAGDTFMAALLTRVAEGEDLHALDGDRLRDLGSFAAGAAAITVQRTGADLPWRADLAATR